MKHPHIVNLYFSLLLITLGLYGLFARYFEMGDWQITSLIPAFFGLILLTMTSGIKKENTIISHIAVVLTIVMAGMVSYLFISKLGSDFNGSRKFFIFLITGLASYIAFGIYLAGFISKKKNK